jgi:hypothetical protein
MTLIMRSLLFFLLVLPGSLCAQGLSGRWVGWLEVSGEAQRYQYHLEITEQDGQINGFSWSISPDSSVIVQFKLTGTRMEDEVKLQELVQLSPEPPAWCLKFSELQLQARNDSMILAGKWRGKPCPPGRLFLSREVEMTYQEEPVPFSLNGEWAGQLDQSDRSYGFFYAVDLEKGGIGSSEIVSEGSGGSAVHELEWSFDSLLGVFLLKELEVIDRTDPRWKWCIKSARLQLEKTDHAYILRGDWEGHIEQDHTPAGQCAPGTVLLEKPILTRRTLRRIQDHRQNYQKQEGREVEVGRILEVARPEIKLSVWDNSKVDGDIVSVFLNGEKIIHQYRLTREKAFVEVNLRERDNFLILHADDLGEITPNTVAVSIYDGTKEHVIIVSSDMR